MKKLLILALLAFGQMNGLMAQKNTKMAEIKFEETSHDFGEVYVDTPVVKYTFVFTNTGDAPLVLHSATASCGCTVPEYTKQPVKPGEKGQIAVTYNGYGMQPGHFSKTITINSNAKSERVRLYITGDITERPTEEKSDVFNKSRIF